MAQSNSKSEIELLYDDICRTQDIEIDFVPMLPKIYDVLLPSLDARLNFLNVGNRHLSLFKYLHGCNIDCKHSAIVSEKINLLNTVISKLLNVNCILEEQEALTNP
ncbi:DNA packaging protein [Murid herpesvirus 3]|uniref:DNA packaging protein n=2 Tax=Murid betaherpesvirus 3 TaxID=2560603 RepID=A0A1P8VIU2_9BETA|nr:DNA packaging protein [Murine roseolovirus]APZ76264.1 DNA packaging protein [Murid betaherpesvirus 3]AYH64817.1 DNA packaging protein [Murid herpesvirus 3]